MRAIKAIPTAYRGVQMRSRLEASFAEQLDFYNIKWVYEAEGYDIDGVWYLPDFWLPDLGAFVEVKGVLDQSVSKPRALAGRIDHPVFLVTPDDVQSWKSGSPTATKLARTDTYDRPAELANCVVCQDLNLHYWQCCVTFYLAGKVYGAGDWRLSIVPGLGRVFSDVGSWPHTGIKYPKAVNGKHTFVGPYFDTEHCKITKFNYYEENIGCHAVDVMRDCKAHDSADSGRTELFATCRKSIRASDFVFAWVDDLTAYGTLVEIGIANGIGVPVYLGGKLSDDLWFAGSASRQVHGDSPKEAFDVAVDLFRRGSR